MTDTNAAPKQTKKAYRGPRPNTGPRQSKGSNYAKKHKGQRKPVVQNKRGEPVFLYYVEGTNIRATKTPCERTAEDRAEKKFSESHLGTWRNPVTGKKCKVVRVRNKPEETNESQSQT